jgi:hypothetical protein
MYLLIHLFILTGSCTRVGLVGWQEGVEDRVPTSAILRTRLKTSQLMLYREIMAVYSEIHTKHINTLCGQKVELLNVKLAVHIVTTGL